MTMMIPVVGGRGNGRSGGPVPSRWPVTGRVPLARLQATPITTGGPVSPEDLRINRALAQREVDNLVTELTKPFPQAGTVTLKRHLAGRGAGGNYEGSAGPGAHAGLGRAPGDWMLAQWSELTVPPGTRLIAFRNSHFTGDRLELGPGWHDLHALGWADAYGPKSGVVMPDVQAQQTIERAIRAIIALSSPQNGCLITAANYDSHPAVQALVRYMDRVIASVGNSPLAADYEREKFRLLADLARGVLANQQACAAKPVAPVGPVPPPPAAAQVCPPGTVVMTNDQYLAAQREGRRFQRVSDLPRRRSCFREIAAPQCVRRWSGRPGDMSNTGPLCITSPEVANCEARGGYLQANLSDSRCATSPSGCPVFCLPRGASARAFTHVPGQGMVPGAPQGFQVENRGGGFGQPALPAPAPNPFAGFGGAVRGNQIQFGDVGLSLVVGGC